MEKEKQQVNANGNGYTPSEGEWCWFYDKDRTNQIPNLRQFSKKTTGAYWVQNSITLSDFFGYSHCEPFIGELPTFIKDKYENN